jgi:o-succinylbenzoate synthase
VKLAALTFTPYALPFVVPFQTARERLAVRHGWLVRVRDGDGREGVGEAAPIAGFGMETLAEAQATLARWAARLPDPFPPLPSGAPGSPPVPFAPLRALLDPQGRMPAACHGLESALADLAAQQAGLPLHAWLLAALGVPERQPLVPDTLAVNATLGALAPEEAARSAAALAAQGFGTLKVKVGVGGAAADAERVRAVRRAAPQVNLRVDANGAWSEAEAADWLERQAELGLEYAEQPLPRDDLAGMARLAASCPVRIAADEALLSAEDARRVLAAHAAQVLVLKPMALGGPLAALHVARMALAAGATVVLTSCLEGVFGRTAALHVAAAAQALAGAQALPAAGLATGTLLREDLLPSPPLAVGGRLHVPREPGLGLGH